MFCSDLCKQLVMLHCMLQNRSSSFRSWKGLQSSSMPAAVSRLTATLLQGWLLQKLRLLVPLMQGAVLTASDISDAMVNETKQKWQRLAVTGSTQPSDTQQPTFEAKDLESVSGKFHTVCCLDVLIHYPQVQLLHGQPGSPLPLVVFGLLPLSDKCRLLRATLSTLFMCSTLFIEYLQRICCPSLPSGDLCLTQWSKMALAISKFMHNCLIVKLAICRLTRGIDGQNIFW